MTVDKYDDLRMAESAFSMTIHLIHRHPSCSSNKHMRQLPIESTEAAAESDDERGHHSFLLLSIVYQHILQVRAVICRRGTRILYDAGASAYVEAHSTRTIDDEYSYHQGIQSLDSGLDQSEQR